ncbi:MAG: UpxY family transcription antiterminator [Saprospiraceae bacterium]|jgi:transcription antitermination factor NusG|nr:UpxY family transcription antiterminator [Saprospiraceae bacterium]HRD82626.1 UpxY family transcription antiterminator [Saprospiraceae bacterium]HRF38906.1 UpxY family transcription antiterminator [Saprospiraceae bacterium]HRJ16000.1 UpxY family transcription antiterminator [Saprospiraceae bacterium]HRK82257.1 UpxY family transcription antiterminator [Saprospiraceae bacterium]
MEAGVKQKAEKKVQEPVNQLDEQTPRWFALYTMAKREKMVAGRLTQKEITCYLPLLHLTRYYTRKIKKVELPLIRGYVFVRITKKEYVPVLETPDVVNFVKFNKNLIAIPEEEIDIIRRVVGDAVQAEAEPISFEPGDEVEIIGGQLTGIRGKLVSRENKREVLLELTTIGLALRVTVKEEYLRRIIKA